MKSMLHELYFGNIRPCERNRVRDGEYVRLTKKISDIVVHFRDLLSPEEYAKFTEMRDLQADAGLFEEVQLFEYAFCLGTLLMIDVFGHSRQSETGIL